MRTFVDVASGALSSSPFYLERGALGFSVMVPSLAAPSSIFVQFAQSSDGTFHDLARADGSGGLHTVYSGPGPGVGYVERPPTPWARIRLATAGEASSFAIIARW